MILGEADIEAALYALHDHVSRRRLAGRGIPPEVLSLYERLQAPCASETENDSGAEQSELTDLIGTPEAAAILGCTTTRIKQIHADLDGVKVGRDWVFLRRNVAEYAMAKGVDGEGNRVPAVGGGAVSAGAA